MIKFFRNIRQTLIMENKTSKYLKYAIGEIILVVIGILIALSINTWNQNRINEKVKKELIENLNGEFEKNKVIIENYKKIGVNSMNSLKLMMKLVGESRETIYNQNLDSIFYHSFPALELSFSENTLRNIMQNEQLSLFKNDELQDLMNQWKTLSDIRANRIEKLENWSNYHYLKFLTSNISFKEMDIYGNYDWTGKSKVKPDYYPLFQKIEFENYIENTLWYRQNVLDRIEETDVLIDKIILATKLKN